VAYRGKSLRAVREQKKIQLKRIADDTRIATLYLNAIEEERFERFPGRFYFKSFTGEYARFLGLDPGEVLRDLQGAYDEWYRHREEQQLAAKSVSSGGGFFTRFAGRFLRPPEV
jgi:cytoskeletal protein RodZ